jgi:outer membrane protein TolC
VRQRPDVRAAEAQLHSTSAQVGVATANMLPQFSITAAGGYAADHFAGLLAASNAFWSVAAGVTQPIFAGGTLLHRKRAAEAAYEQASAQYRSTVLAALQNAADTLAALQWDAEGLRAAVKAEEAAARTLAIARRQLELGDIGYPALLVTNLAYQQAVLARVQAQASRYADTAALFQAMGGGWWNRALVPASAEASPTRTGERS